MSRKKKKVRSPKVEPVFLFVALLLAVVAIYFFLISKKNTSNKIQDGISELTGSAKATTTKTNDLDVSKLDLLGRAKVSFVGGTEGRKKNIEIGLAKINNTIVESGKEFSFKDVLGTTTPEMGYSRERVFLNGEVKKEIGGGICQVSTTLFRSVLDSGLPVTQRTNHSFTVSYYDVGLDATYSDPGPDFKFLNDTKNPIVIKGKVEDSSAVFEIFGVKDGRVASTTEAEITKLVDILPTKYIYVEKLEEDQVKCINNPQIGYTATVKYGVQYPNGEYKEKDFVSRYRPLQRVCYIVGEEIKDFDINKILR
ncbi:MAG: VanW family protein [Minisyncoccia bacterium]